MSSSASVRSAWGLVLVFGFFMFFLGLYLGHLSVSKPGPYLSVLQSYWNLHVWNRREALFLSSVSRYLCLSIVFTSDLEYFALLVLCGLHWHSPGVCGVGENKITIEFVASAGVVRVAVCLSRVNIRVETTSYVGSWTAPKTRQPVGALSIRLVGAWYGYCEGSFRRVSSNCPDAHPVPERFPEGQQHH